MCCVLVLFANFNGSHLLKIFSKNLVAYKQNLGMEILGKKRGLKFLIKNKIVDHSQSRNLSNLYSVGSSFSSLPMRTGLLFDQRNSYWTEKVWKNNEVQRNLFRKGSGNMGLFASLYFMAVHEKPLLYGVVNKKYLGYGFPKVRQQGGLAKSFDEITFESICPKAQSLGLTNVVYFKESLSPNLKINCLQEKAL